MTHFYKQEMECCADQQQDDAPDVKAQFADPRVEALGRKERFGKENSSRDAPEGVQAGEEHCPDPIDPAGPAERDVEAKEMGVENGLQGESFGKKAKRKAKQDNACPAKP